MTEEKTDTTRKRRRAPPEIDEKAARELVTSLFFGFLPEPAASTEKEDVTNKDKTNLTTADKARQPFLSKQSEASAVNDSTAKIMSAIRIEEHIPMDAQEIREKPVFQSTYNLLQWQRDNYLVGPDYADWRKAERRQQRSLFRGVAVHDIPPDYASALGHGQVANLAANFIPSDTVRQAALPLLLSLSVPAGPLFAPACQATVGVILGQQSNLDNLVKNTILNYLKNPQNRIAVKNSTQGYIASTTYRKNGSSTTTPNGTIRE